MSSVVVRMDPLCFQAGVDKRQFILCCGIFVFQMNVLFSVLHIVSSVLAKRSAGKNVFEITYFVSGRT